MKDLVLDTNVLVHAGSSDEKHCEDSRNLLKLLREGNTEICVDEGFSSDPATNRSAIVQEYQANLFSGMFGWEVLRFLFIDQRVRGVSTRVGTALRKALLQSIPNKRDRTFLKVTNNTEHQTLASNDKQDFTARVRRDVQKRFGLTVVFPGQLIAVLAPPPEVASPTTTPDVTSS